MNVVYLLPNHPTAPQSKTFETLLPDLILIFGFSKEFIRIGLNKTFGGETLQFSNPGLDVSVAGIYDQVEVVRHNNEANELGVAPFNE